MTPNLALCYLSKQKRTIGYNLANRKIPHKFNPGNLHSADKESLRNINLNKKSKNIHYQFIKINTNRM